MQKKTQNIQFLLSGDSLELKPVGEIDHHNAVVMRREADEIINTYKPKNVALNLEKIDFMDSSGLGFIMGRYSLVQKIGGTLVVKSPSKNVQRICRLAGLERIVKIVK